MWRCCLLTASTAARLLPAHQALQRVDASGTHLPVCHADGIILAEAYARHAARWVDLGASIVGGCCGVGPRHIELIRRRL